MKRGLLVNIILILIGTLFFACSGEKEPSETTSEERDIVIAVTTEPKYYNNLPQGTTQAL
jgi:hypothetical protein